MSRYKQKTVIFFALIITCALAYFAPSENSKVLIVSAVERESYSKESVEIVKKNSFKTNSPIKERKAFDPPQRDLFNVIRPPEAAPIIEKPKAPPLPFSYIGKQTDGGKTKFFLITKKKTYIVSIGDTIENNYLIENVVGKNMVIKFLPLDEQQTLLMP